MEPLLTLEDVCGYLKVKPATIYKMVRERRIPYIKQGGILRFKVSALEHWEKQHTQRTLTPA